MSRHESTGTTTPETNRSRDDATRAAQRFGHVLRSEFLRIGTVRSTWIGMAAAIVLPILLTLGDVLTSDDPSRIDLGARVAQTLFPSIVIVAAVASTFVTAEYATGMMRISYANTPLRRRVVDGRVLASVAYAVAAVWVCAMVALGVGAMLVVIRGGSVTITAAGMRCIGLAGLVTAAYLLIADAVAFAWRSTPAVSSFVAIYPFVESLLVDVLRQTRWQVLSQWFPLSAGWSAAMDVQPPPGVDFSYLGRPWGLVYLVAWALALMALARAKELRGRE